MKLLGSYIDDTGGSFNLKGFQVDVFEIFILYFIWSKQLQLAFVLKSHTLF